MCVREQSYSTAEAALEAANAAAEEELLGPPVPELGVDGNPIEDDLVERCFEYDHRGENKSGYILEYGCTGCHVITKVFLSHDGIQCQNPDTGLLVLMLFGVVICELLKLYCVY